MSRNLLDRYDTDRRPWSVLIAILIAAALGSISLPVQVLLAKQSQSATHDQVAHNQQIIENNARIARVERAALCRRINQIIEYDRLPVEPCPNPTVAP